MGVKLEYYKSNLTFENINEFKLFLLLRRSSLSFFILDLKEEELVYFKNVLYQEHFEETFKKLYSTDDVLSKFSEIECLGLDVHGFNLIPDRLYNPAHRASYFKDLADLSGKEIGDDLLADQTTRILYLKDAATYEFIEQYYDVGKIVPNFGGLVNSSLQAEDPYVFLMHFDEKNLFVYYIENRQLKFLNRFEFHSSADVLYYTLKVCSLLKLDPKSLHVKLSGNIDQESEIFKLLHRYIFELSIYTLNENYNIPLSDNEIHYFNDIFALLKK